MVMILYLECKKKSFLTQSEFQKTKNSPKMDNSLFQSRNELEYAPLAIYPDHRDKPNQGE
ncbi:hypothetical protein AB835_08705 [Candidatus Endobugula sertula]|uniref:Uncharacterized protein n=1 Tax=Candidatus Endobugula sertula TaxID=62101 RepID=A0A1D2QPM1_9GAMM|nr:hypothetical protein AB835_08705 [Candidatus Endobugula sertula]